MPVLQIVRGTASLPTDIEEQFHHAYGREMNDQERAFYGLKSQSETQQIERQLPIAA
jgi:hypothetical protein